MNFEAILLVSLFSLGLSIAIIWAIFKIQSNTRKAKVYAYLQILVTLKLAEKEPRDIDMNELLQRAENNA
jgi:flagellar biogenesis protein FliO